jgi:hypothetical protein
MLAVVLVLDDRLHLSEARGELLAGRRALVGAAIGIAAPIEIDLGEVFAGLPQPACRLAWSAPIPSACNAARSARTRAASGLSSSASSRAATACTAASNRRIRLAKASRKKPETRRVTSTRGRSSRLNGRISKSSTRWLPVAHTGRTPISAMAWAMSSPPVRMVAVPHTDNPSWRK